MTQGVDGKDWSKIHRVLRMYDDVQTAVKIDDAVPKEGGSHGVHDRPHRCGQLTRLLCVVLVVKSCVYLQQRVADDRHAAVVYYRTDRPKHYSSSRPLSTTRLPPHLLICDVVCRESLVAVGERLPKAELRDADDDLAILPDLDGVIDHHSHALQTREDVADVLRRGCEVGEENVLPVLGNVVASDDATAEDHSRGVDDADDRLCVLSDAVLQVRESHHQHRVDRQIVQLRQLRENLLDPWTEDDEVARQFASSLELDLISTWDDRHERTCPECRKRSRPCSPGCLSAPSECCPGRTPSPVADSPVNGFGSFRTPFLQSIRSGKETIDIRVQILQTAVMGDHFVIGNQVSLRHRLFDT